MVIVVYRRRCALVILGVCLLFLRFVTQATALGATRLLVVSICHAFFSQLCFLWLHAEQSNTTVVAGYLHTREEWCAYDATELIASGVCPNSAYDEILIDVGTADSFLTGGQLLPEVNFDQFCNITPNFNQLVHVNCDVCATRRLKLLQIKRVNGFLCACR